MAGGGDSPGLGLAAGAGAGLHTVCGAGGRSGDGPGTESVGVVGADDVRPVPGADAGRHGGAVLQDEGVVIGGKAGGLNFAAHL